VLGLVEKAIKQERKMKYLRMFWCWLRSLFRSKDSADRTLYIIGNGFDIHHGLDTWYSSFGLFLKNKSSQIYQYITDYLCLPELYEDKPESLYDTLWSNFEEGFARMEIDQVLDDHSDYAMDLTAEKNMAREYHQMQQMVDLVKEGLTIELRDEFRAFISNVSYPEEPRNGKLCINSKARFFSFNYTDTLEKYYQVSTDKILHIHGKASNGDNLKLGHGFDPQDFQPEEPQPPVDASDEELSDWHDQMAAQSDYSYDSAKASLSKYFEDSLKSTEQMISDNEDYFNSIGNINRVVVLGHSLAKVDEPYLVRIKDSIDPCANWVVSYYLDKEKQEHRDKLMKLGISEERISVCKMNMIT